MALQFDFGFRRRNAERKANEFERRIDLIAANVAGRFARGSVAFQRGFVVTRKQLDAEREALKAARPR